jgi:hypothetical protein
MWYERSLIGLNCVRKFKYILCCNVVWFVKYYLKHIGKQAKAQVGCKKILAHFWQLSDYSLSDY